jgi:hypothetical protein
VDVVAVAALDQALADAMVEGLAEFGPGIGVTPEAQIGLPAGQQEFGLRGMVRGMAIEAAHVIAGVRGILEVPLPVFFAVAAEAARVGFSPG